MNMFFLYMFGASWSWRGSQSLLAVLLSDWRRRGNLNVIVKVSLFWGGHPLILRPSAPPGAIFGVLLLCRYSFSGSQVVMFRFRENAHAHLLIVMLRWNSSPHLGFGGDTVSHICHFGGMLVGWVYFRRVSFLYSVRNTVTDWHTGRIASASSYINNTKKDRPPAPTTGSLA